MLEIDRVALKSINWLNNIYVWSIKPIFRGKRIEFYQKNKAFDNNLG